MTGLQVEGAPRLHLQGVLLPEGEPRDLWVVDGVVRTEPVRDATRWRPAAGSMPAWSTRTATSGWSGTAPCPPRSPSSTPSPTAPPGPCCCATPEPADTRWIDDREDLPRLIRAGRHIARPKRYLRNYADEVEPESLVVAVERQAARGDGWVKLVGDWIDREIGDLAPLWPPDVAAAAIARAHALGARVTAHVFGEQAATELVAAGIDGIEHGTGLSDATIEVMAARQVALVPTMVQLRTSRASPPRRAEVPDLRGTPAGPVRGTAGVFRRAHEAGVPIYAGTDAGGYLPHGLVGQEMGLLAGFARRARPGRRLLAGPRLAGPARDPGRGGAGRPRRLRRDPARDLGVLRHPRPVVLRGRVVG